MNLAFSIFLYFSAIQKDSHDLIFHFLHYRLRQNFQQMLLYTGLHCSSISSHLRFVAQLILVIWYMNFLLYLITADFV